MSELGGKRRFRNRLSPIMSTTTVTTVHHHSDTTVYEEVPLASMDFDAGQQLYTYECPCGEFFEIGLDELHEGEDIAPCTGCTLKIKVQRSVPLYIHS